MADEIDTLDRRILAELQRDGTLSVDQLSQRVNLSRNACWRRVKRLEEERVAITSAASLWSTPTGSRRARSGVHPDPHVGHETDWPLKRLP